jgi:hypothetical protein
MKLHLQPANMLPIAANIATTEANGKGAFGTTMQETMAMLPPGKSFQEVIPQRLARMQSPTGKDSEHNNAGEAVNDSTGQIGKLYVAAENARQIRLSHDAVSPGKVMNGSELPASNSLPPTKEPAVSEKIPEHIVQGPIFEGLPVQSPIVQQIPHVISEHRARRPQPSLVGAMSQLARASKDAPSQARHRAEGAADEGNGPPTHGQSSEVPAASLFVSLAVPVPIPLSDGSQSSVSTFSGKGQDSEVDTQGASRRAPVPPMIAAPDESHAGPPVAPASPTQASRRGTIAVDGDKFPEPVGPDRNTAGSANTSHLLPKPTGKIDAGAVRPANQDLHPQAPPMAGMVTNAKQIDTHAQKESGKRIETERQSEATVNLPRHTNQVSTTTHHQAAPNAAVPQGAQKTTDAHRPQATAAQVLQRMDAAGPSGAVQLRADARRLDVGVASGALGWVEVRATTTASGRIDATLQVQSDSSAHALMSQSTEIADYARDHSVSLGELSVGVGTGDGARDESKSEHSDRRNGPAATDREPMHLPAKDEHSHRPAETVSFISVRA